jgi:DNA-binding transcriptional ArsR family regulator
VSDPLVTYGRTAYEVIKALRGRWLTSGELVSELDISRGSIDGHLREAFVNGIVLKRRREGVVGGSPSGRAAHEFTLAPAWMGGAV